MKTFILLRKERGFSLTELMVAITLSLIILAAVAAIFVNTRKAYTTQDRLARVQENGRFAMHYLIRDLRTAGYTGCRKDITEGQQTPSAEYPDDVGKLTFNLTVPPTDFLYGLSNMAVAIEGIENVASSGSVWRPSNSNALPASFKSSVVADNYSTDMLTIRTVDTAAMFPITNDMAAATDTVGVDPLTAAIRFRKNDIVLVADCNHGDLFEITNTPSAATPFLEHDTSGNRGNKTTSLSKPYKASEFAQVFRFTSRRYYVRNNPNGAPSLYRDDEELVEGIESLQILYGVDSDNSDGNFSPDRYLAAGAPGLVTADDWKKVVAVRIGILALTPNAKDTDLDNNPHDVNGTIVGPKASPDRNQRRVFVSTIVLKNRVVP